MSLPVALALVSVPYVVLLVAAIPGELRREEPPLRRERPIGWCTAAARERRTRLDPGAGWVPLPRLTPPSWALRGWTDPEVIDEPVTWSAVLPAVVHPRSPWGRGDVPDRLLLPTWDDPSPATQQMEALDA